MFDPGCCIWPATEADSGQGRHITVAGTDLQERFQDQFAAWSFASSTDAKNEPNSTLIRIPLDRKPNSRLAEACTLECNS